ncbi:MAG: carbon-nitrogen hydrolase family protein [Deltaproteobacteria bacterium]|nr:MAG: carbon-nitrogen hydrolase family protein [Deltaproteobacteria bacterium]
MLRQTLCIYFVFALISVIPQSSFASSMDAMQVACVQLEMNQDINNNAQAIVKALKSESQRGTRLVVFPEGALTPHVKLIRQLDQKQIDQALNSIRQACRQFDIYAVVGSAYKHDGKWYNGAFVIGPKGQIVKRYTKLHVVLPKLYENGNELAIFNIDDVPTTIIICHDERYPELVRIPVLAGAKLCIYISCESKILKKLDNCRSQIIARAVENQISVIHCNAGDGDGDIGSYGRSRIIDRVGTVLAQADSKVGQTIRATVHPRDSRNGYARAGARTPSLQKFWAEGLRVLKEQNPEFFAKNTVSETETR